MTGRLIDCQSFAEKTNYDSLKYTVSEGRAIRHITVMFAMQSFKSQTQAF